MNIRLVTNTREIQYQTLMTPEMKKILKTVADAKRCVDNTMSLINRGYVFCIEPDIGSNVVFMPSVQRPRMSIKTGDLVSEASDGYYVVREENDSYYVHSVFKIAALSDQGRTKIDNSDFIEAILESGVKILQSSKRKMLDIATEA